MRRLIALIVYCMCGVGMLLAQQSDEQVAAYYYDHGEYAQAAQLYEGLYKRGTNKYHYQRLLSAYLELGEYKEAMRLVERRQKSHPKELSLLVDEGTVYQRQRQEKKAVRCYDKAVERIGSNQQPVADLAQAFLSAGRPDYAARTYLAARSATSNRTLYFTELVTVYQKMVNYEAMTGEYFDLLDHQPGMMSSVQVSMQRMLQEAPDRRLADGVRRALVSRVQEHPDNKVYLEMMIWFSLQENDFGFALEQAEAVDARFPEQGGDQVMRVSQISQKNGAYDVAADGYRYLQRKGKEDVHYFDARVGELEVEFARINHNYTIDTKNLASLRARYLSAFDELGRNERTVPLMRHYATLMAYHGGDAQEAVSTLDDVLELPRLKPQVRDEVKLELGDLLLFAGQTWDASLLYMQVEKANKNDVLGAAAKFRNAKLSYYSHDFEWAKSQLDVLRSSTSKLVANDAMELSLLISDNMEDDSTYDMLALFADADLLLYRGQLDSAWDAFDAVGRAVLSHPLLDEVLMRKAQIRMKQARYAEADSLLQRLVDFYPYDITADDALMLRAELNEDHLANPQTALECYEKLLLDYPTSLYVDRARKRYNALKAR
ncbi:MAG: tetratricopeptide repeat protein [Bacteroidales bacterium]|nr:tetratricopeptide repeat protein [Bacteroidales bacterium]